MGPFLRVEEGLCVPGHEDTGDTGAGVELPLPVPSPSGLCPPRARRRHSKWHCILKGQAGFFQVPFLRFI